MFQEINRIDYKSQILTNSLTENIIITPALKKITLTQNSRKNRIIYTLLMLTYTSYYNIAPPYLCELISKIESNVNIRLGTGHHQFPPISKYYSNTVIEHSFMYAAPYEWN